MNKIVVIFTVAFCFLAFAAKSQDENAAVLIKIGNDEVYLSEFLDQFNITKDQLKDLDPATLDNYLDLYLQFKLKIKESQALGLDTIRTFKNEFQEYRDKAVSQHMYDKDLHESILKELYNRSSYIVKVSMISVNVPNDASPKDTLAAYQKALNIRNRVLKGEDFWVLAEKLSDDSTARDHMHPLYNTPEKGNKGDFGFLSVFYLPQTVEDFCYTAKEGDISMPIRSYSNYVILLLEKKGRFYGHVTLSHIWVSDKLTPDSLEGNKKISDAYHFLKEGNDFAEAAKKYSDDKGASATGGKISNVDITEIIPEYTTALISMDTGEVSKPFQTPYGWHIVKLIKKTEIPAYEDLYASLEHKAILYKRNLAAVDKFIDAQKKVRNFKEVSAKNLGTALKETENSLDDHVFSSDWSIPAKAESLKKPLFSVNNQNYNQQDLLVFIEKNQKKGDPLRYNEYVKWQYKAMIDSIILKIADSAFVKEIPSLKKTVQSFYDGLLVYSFNEETAWNKALLDSAGLADFYNHIKESHFSLENIDANPYMWNERAEITQWNIEKSDCFDLVKCNKELKKGRDIKSNDTALYEKLQKTIRKKCREDKEASISFQNIILNTEDLKKNTCLWKDEICETSDSTTHTFLVIKKALSPALKELDEAKGYYVNDYQQYLEKNSIDTLLKKYQFTVYTEVLK